MLFPDPTTLTAADLAAPELDAEALGQVATYRPDLRHAVLAHPNASAELVQWIVAQPDTPAAPAAEQPAAPDSPAAPAAPAWGAPPEQPAAPAAEAPAEAAAAPAAPEWSAPPAQPAAPAAPAAEPAWGQAPPAPEQPAAPAWGGPAQAAPAAAAGAAPGAPAAPNAQGGQGGQDENGFDRAVQQGAEAAQAFGRDFAARTQEVAGQKDWKAWLPLAVPAFSLLGFIALFLPFMTAKGSVMGVSSGGSLSGFETFNGFVSTLLVILFLGLAGFSAYVFATRKTAFAKLVSILGIVAGGLGTLMTIIGLARIGSEASKFNSIGFGRVEAGLGFGGVLLLICSVIILAVSILALVSERKKA